VHIPQRAKAIDPSGAGDTAIAVLLSGLLAGATAEEAGFLANAACGVVVRKVGTAAVTVAELNDALNQESSEHEESRIS
jgi:D-beta-D-heptose 7-phosphate kinase/D-beta-D-heptose 1-phosphate adenosyltransferase